VKTLGRFLVVALLVVGMVNVASANTVGSVGFQYYTGTNNLQGEQGWVLDFDSSGEKKIEVGLCKDGYDSAVDGWDKTVIEDASSGSVEADESHTGKSNGNYFTVTQKQFDTGKHRVYVDSGGAYNCDFSDNPPLSTSTFDVVSGWSSGSSSNTGYVISKIRVTSINDPPSIDSSSINPDPPLIGETADFSYTASDSDGTISSVDLTLKDDGSTVFHADGERPG